MMGYAPFLGQVRIVRLGQEQPVTPPAPVMRDVLTVSQRQDLAAKIRRVWAENPGCIASPQERAGINIDVAVAKIVAGDETWADLQPQIAMIEECYAALSPVVPTWAWVMGGVAAAGLIAFVATR